MLPLSLRTFEQQRRLNCPKICELTGVDAKCSVWQLRMNALTFMALCTCKSRELIQAKRFD